MIFSSADILSQQQLKRLSEHKYSCSGSSFADPFMQPFWNWVTSKCPLWLAPNLMTLSGLFVNIATSLVLVWYSPTATQEVRDGARVATVGFFHSVAASAIRARPSHTRHPLDPLSGRGTPSAGVSPDDAGVRGRAAEKFLASPASSFPLAHPPRLLSAHFDGAASQGRLSSKVDPLSTARAPFLPF